MAFLLWTSMSSLGPSGRSRPKSLAPFRLDLRSAAVNEQFDTGDETGVIRREKQRHLSNFLGFPHASHRDCRHNPRNQVCRLPTRQRRIDRTRTNNVLNSVDRRHRAVTRLHAELSPFVCSQSAAQRRYANCRSGPRLQKVEPVPHPEAFAFEIRRVVARVSKKASKLGMDLSKRNYGVLESRANLIF